MNTAKNIYCIHCICSWILIGFVIMATPDAHAETVVYSLNNVVLDDGGRPMSGTFSWTFDVGDFENGFGVFTYLDIPFTLHDHTDLDATFDIGSSIEITLAGSVHDDGVDITLFLLQPLTPTTSSSIDLARSKYEIGGNGFHDGSFLSGSIEAVLDPGDANGDGVVDGADYTIWADHFGIADPLGPSEGDFNSDGNVDGADYTIWADNFGTIMGLEGQGGGGAEAESFEDPVPSCGLGFELIIPLFCVWGVLKSRRQSGAI